MSLKLAAFGSDPFVYIEWRQNGCPQNFRFLTILKK